MTKQEEIREGIGDKRARIDGWLKGYLFEVVSFANQNRSLHMIDASWYEGEIKRIKEALHSQGVVIKVKCPDCEWSQFAEEELVGMTPCLSCNSTGYIMEPLIKEGD